MAGQPQEDVRAWAQEPPGEPGANNMRGIPDPLEPAARRPLPDIDPAQRERQLRHVQQRAIMSRSDIYARPMRAGRPVPDGAVPRAWTSLKYTLAGEQRRREWAVDEQLLGAPADAEVMAQMTPGLYGRLLDVLEHYYEVLILDLGTGITDPIAQFAVQRADQSVVITTPEWITSAGVLGALRYLQLEEGTLVLNQAATRRGGAARQVIEETFARYAVATRATIPYDQQLRLMLDTGTYTLDSLKRSTRIPIKELGAAIARNFV